MLATICIILAGIQYRFVNPDFKNFPWSPLSALEIASIIYAFFVGFIAYFAFSKPSTAVITFFTIFIILSILFTLAISIFALIAGSTGFLDIYFGCNAKINGLMEVWQGLDNYLLNADRAFCSQECPCFIGNTVPFEFNTTVAPSFQKWVRTNQNGGGAINFQGCPGNVRQNVYNEAVGSNPLFDPNKQFNDQRFFDYMSRFENQFKCTGFCFNRYKNPSTNEDQTLWKYMFSDINNGVPHHSGCLNSILQWLPTYMLAYGSVGMVLAGVQIALLIIGLLLLKSRKEHREEKYHQDIEVREVREVRPVEVRDVKLSERRAL